jgi:hypothetical protein
VTGAFEVSRPIEPDGDHRSSPPVIDTPVTSTYRDTQNVRRSFQAECGEHFKFDRSLMSEIESTAEDSSTAPLFKVMRRRASKAEPRT